MNFFEGIVIYISLLFSLTANKVCITSHTAATKKDQQTEVVQPATYSPPSKRSKHATESDENKASDITIITTSNSSISAYVFINGREGVTNQQLSNSETRTTI